MPSEHRNALPPGYRLQEYRIESILGHGGFGITYLATDTHLEQWVAIKEYLPNAYAVREGVSTVYAKCSDDEEAFQWGLQRFILEARTLAHFHHQAIVRVLRFFEENRTAYMVMEYQEGRSLAEILKERPLDEKDLLAVVLPVLDGLEQVHAAGFLHRDIKPGNIFIRKDGSPVLLDFGSARYAMGSRSSDLTSIVSPGYAPFEQYDRNTEQGPWTDIYGLGAVMYHAITGQPPPEVVGRLKNDQMVRAEEASAGRYRKELLRAVDWALALDEQARPQSIAEWREALLNGPLEILPKPETPLPRLEESAQRRFGLAAGLLLLFAVAVAGGILLYRQAGGPGWVTPPPAVQSGQKIAEAQVQALIEQYFAATGKQDLGALMSLYAAEVDYLSWGWVSQESIRHDKQEYFARWPEIRYQLQGDFHPLELSRPDEMLVEFVFDYSVRNPASPDGITRVSGQSKYTWRLQAQAGGLKIVLHKEKVLTRRKNDESRVEQ